MSLIGCQTLNETHENSVKNSVTLNEIKDGQELIIPKLEALDSALKLQADTQAKLNECDTKLVQTLEKYNVAMQNLNSCQLNANAKKNNANQSAQPSKEQISAVKSPSRSFEGKMIFGEAEWFYISEIDAEIEARIDTGASVSSISAVNIKEFERNGKNWLSFDLPLKKNKSVTIEAPLVGYIDIKNSTLTKHETRPVVKLHFKIGDYSSVGEFNLRDRSHIQYPLLIGRNIMKDIAIVDVSRIHVQPQVEKKSMSISSFKKDNKFNEIIPDSNQVVINKKEADPIIVAKPANKKNQDKDENTENKDTNNKNLDKTNKSDKK